MRNLSSTPIQQRMKEGFNIKYRPFISLKAPHIPFLPKAPHNTVEAQPSGRQYFYVGKER